MRELLWNKLKGIINNSLFPHKKSRLQRYLMPVIFSFAVLVIKYILTIYHAQDLSSHLIFIAIILSAWYGGLGPGIFGALLISIVNDYFFEIPFSVFDYQKAVDVIVYVIEGILVSIIAEAKMQSDLQKDEFIGFASHELKNPLAAIKGFSSLLQKKLSVRKDKKLSEMAQKIEIQANLANSLINELLDVTRIDVRTLEIKKKQCNINELVKNTIADMKIVTPNQDIILKGTCKKKIMADTSRIKQVLNNLMTNAIKYSPKADSIVVTCSDYDQGILVSVQDFGIGIAKKDLKKVFDRFFRTNSAERISSKGLGLGLYISYQIIKKHHGKLWVKSTVGRGSTFFLSLPLRG